MNRFREWFADRPGRPWILAHRGDSFRAPENTIEAARLGHQAGADGWELDVQLTRDGVPVVIHDSSLIRTTDVRERYPQDPRAARGYRVEDFEALEIAALDAGRWFLPPASGPRTASGFGSLSRIAPADLAHYQSGQVRVPTLATALDWTRQLDWPVNVEIKAGSGDPTPLVEATLDQIRRHDALSLVTVSSFDHAIVRMVVDREPRVAAGALLEHLPETPSGDLLRRIGADALHLSAESVLDPAIPESRFAIDLRGIPLLIYTVNDAGPAGPARQLADRGVAGLFTDDPASFSSLGLSPSGGRTRFHSTTVERPAGDL